MSARRQQRAALVHDARAQTELIPRWVREFRLSDWPNAAPHLMGAMHAWRRARVAWCDEHGVDLLELQPAWHQRRAAQDPTLADRLRRGLRDLATALPQEAPSGPGLARRTTTRSTLTRSRGVQ